LNVGEIGALPSLLEQDPSRSLPVPVAPQWHVISRITEAEALLRIGKVDDGLAHLKTALLGAELCSLPHQVQRAIRAVQVVEAYHPCTGYLGHPFKNKPFETEKDLLPLLANRGGWM
jgi:hypothetical protein